MAVNMPTLEEFTGLNLAALNDCEIALLNLSAACGLPGTDDLNVDVLLPTLDEWAEAVKFEICRHLYRFDFEADREPTDFSYGNSLGRFFCWYMLQVLQQDCGVAYHPDRKFNPDFCNPEDLFIHGIVSENGKGGTCASMPVVYVAVGRRLGLPLYLVQTRGHLFFRWDDSLGTTIHWQNPDLKLWIPPDRFNVEGSGEGIAYYSDAHYIQWPELWKEHDFEHGRYLRSMTPKEELADFLVQRAECWRELGNWTECEKAIYHAIQLEPDDHRFRWLAGKWAHEFRQAEAERQSRIQEMESERRQRLAKAEPAIPGHPVECPCQRCREVKRIQQSTPPGHGPSCRCLHCEKIKILRGESNGLPHHPPACPCPDCRKGREYSQQSNGLPGHPPNCLCAGCLQTRHAGPNQQPRNPAVPSQPAHLPQPQLPGIAQPHAGQPIHPGLPGF